MRRRDIGRFANRELGVGAFVGAALANHHQASCNPDAHGQRRLGLKRRYRGYDIETGTHRPAGVILMGHWPAEIDQ